MGSWESTRAPGLEVTFRSDGTYGVTLPDQLGPGAEISGNYEVDRNRVRLTQPKLAVELPFGVPTPDLSRFFPDQIDLDVAFKTDDEVVIAGNMMLQGNYKRKTRQ